MSPSRLTACEREATGSLRVLERVAGAAGEDVG